MNPINRRLFLRLTATSSFAAGLAAWETDSALGIEPIKRSGPPRLRVGLVAYSLRDYFIDSSHPRSKTAPASPRIDMLQFIDYCVEQGCQGAELTGYYFPPEVSDDYLMQVKRHAFLSGVEISGTSVGNDFSLPLGEKRDAQIASVKRWVDHAQVLGAPYLRVFAGDPKGSSVAERKSLCVAALEECAEYAGRKGVMLGLEDHGGIVAEADDMIEVIRAVKSPWLGVNLDVGNFRTDDPYADLAKCAPYAINVHWKTELRRRNQKENEQADLARLIKLLRDANYQGFVSLEYENQEDPLKAVPTILKRTKELIAE